MRTDRPAGARPMTPLGCALGCGAWLAVMAVPLLAFVLATQNELTWSRGPAGLVQDKVFVINEPGASGLGYQAARLVGGEAAAGGPICLRTTVVYLLWRNDEGGDPNVSYCQCYTRAADGALVLAAAACPGD